jgi:hypothetical protein
VVEGKLESTAAQSALLHSCQMRREALALCLLAGRGNAGGRAKHHSPRPAHRPQPQTWGVESGDLLARTLRQRREAALTVPLTVPLTSQCMSS